MMAACRNVETYAAAQVSNHPSLLLMSTNSNPGILLAGI